MKEQKLTSKLRSKFTGMENAKAYKLERTEALEFLKKYFLDPCESAEQLDSLKLVPVFPIFKDHECILNGWMCKRYILPNSLTSYSNIVFYDAENVYSCGLFWLTGGSFKRKYKRLVNEKRAELEKK